VAAKQIVSVSLLLLILFHHRRRRLWKIPNLVTVGKVSLTGTPKRRSSTVRVQVPQIDTKLTVAVAAADDSAFEKSHP